MKTLPRLNAAEVEAAITDARGGTPAVVAIEGPQGSGKTTLLEDIVARTEGFERLVTEGSDQDLDSYSTLARAGVKIPPTASPLVAAQTVRERLDRDLKRRPMLLAVDDAQWADRATVTAVAHLLERSQQGDSLLIVIASHSELPSTRERIEESASGTMRRIRLEGLSFAEAQQLAIDSGQRISEEAILRIWELTKGNPLHFTSIIHEYEANEAVTMDFLPAPDAFSRSINRRVDRIGADASAIMRASAVFGDAWKPIPLVAAVAGVREPGAAVEALLQAGLIVHRPSNAALGFIRPIHALVRAAVYQRIGLTERSDLHLAAASAESDHDAALAHRATAAMSFDAGLAEELEKAARHNHDIGSFRRAADQLRLASKLVPNPAAQRRYHLDSLFEQTLAGGLADPTEELAAVYEDGDGRVPLVAAAAALHDNRWTDAMRHLQPIIATPLTSTDPLVRYRCETLAAWAGNGIGMPTEWLAERFEQARATGAVDPIMHGYLTLTELQLSGREFGMPGYLKFAAWLPQRAAEVPIEHSYELMGRGIARALAGDATSAKADLSEMERRIQLGFMDLGDGVTHGFLGLAHWLGGEWQLAEVKFRTAREVVRSSANPVASSLSALGLVGAGRFDESDLLLGDVRERLIREPWWEAVSVYTVVLGMRLHAGFDDVSQASALDSLEADLGDVARDLSFSYPVWLVPRAWLAIWAGRLEEAASLADRLDQPSDQRWVGAASHWLRALIAEREGHRGRARREIDDALNGGMREVPLFLAHCLEDRARIAENRIDHADAVALYRDLGQVPYVDHFQAEVLGPTDTARPALLGPLSDRELDVFTLISTGLSYAQVARDLFISKSTVAFHLSNIYAKTGVNSRHALVALARSGA